jgi:hypothetical protein
MAYVRDKNGKIVAGINDNYLDKYRSEYESKGYKVDTSTSLNKPKKKSSAETLRDALEMDGKGWYVTPDGKHLNPKLYDEYGVRLTVPKIKTSYNDNSSMITDQYDAQRKSLIAQLKQKIAEAKQGLQPMRNEVEVGRNQNVNALREALANSGDRGGLGRQELLGVNTAADNQLNNINLSEANIDRQAAFEESSINADTAAAKLQAILAEKTRADEMSEDIRRYNNDYGLKLEDRSIAAKDREAEAAENALKREIETIGRYYTDFQAEINRRTNSADKADDALVPYLEAARAEKIAKQLADADNSASQAYKNAYNMWLQLGVATPEVARILGIEAGAKTLDKVKAEYSTSKPYYNPNTGGGSSGNGLSW